MYCVVYYNKNLTQLLASLGVRELGATSKARFLTRLKRVYESRREKVFFKRNLYRRMDNQLNTVRLLMKCVDWQAEVNAVEIIKRVLGG